jgi:hypothetical protein
MYSYFESTTLDIKTTQEAYTPEELMRLLPVMEIYRPELVRPTVALIEGARLCEFAVQVVINDRKQWVYLTEDQITITPRFDGEGNLFDPPKVCLEIPKALAKSGRKPGKGRHIELTVFGARYFAKYRNTTHILAPVRVSEGKDL